MKAHKHLLFQLTWTLAHRKQRSEWRIPIWCLGSLFITVVLFPSNALNLVVCCCSIWNLIRILSLVLCLNNLHYWLKCWFISVLKSTTFLWTVLHLLKTQDWFLLPIKILWVTNRKKKRGTQSVEISCLSCKSRGYGIFLLWIAGLR